MKKIKAGPLQTRTQCLSLILINTYARTQTLKLTYSYSSTHMCTHSRSHTHPHIHTLADTLTHTHVHMHTYSHTHSFFSVPIFISCACFSLQYFLFLYIREVTVHAMLKSFLNQVVSSFFSLSFFDVPIYGASLDVALSIPPSSFRALTRTACS